jgi:hypothetical protein
LSLSFFFIALLCPATSKNFSFFTQAFLYPIPEIMKTLLNDDTRTCFKGGGEIVHLTGVDIVGTAADSSLSNVFTISGIGYKKACVKKEKFLDVAGQSRAIKKNDKDKQLVIVQKL